MIKQYVNLDPDDPEELGTGAHQVPKERAGRTVKLRAKVSPARENVFVKFTLSPGAQNTPPEKLTKEDRAHFPGGRESGALAVTDRDGVARMRLHLSVAGLDEFTVKAHVLLEGSPQELVGPTFQVWRRLYLETWTLNEGKPGPKREGTRYSAPMPDLVFPNVEARVAAELKKLGVDAVFEEKGRTSITSGQARPAVLQPAEFKQLCRKHAVVGPRLALVAVDQLGEKSVQALSFVGKKSGALLPTGRLWVDPSVEEKTDWLVSARFLVPGGANGPTSSGFSVPLECFERVPSPFLSGELVGPASASLRTGRSRNQIRITPEYEKWLLREGLHGATGTLALVVNRRIGEPAGLVMKPNAAEQLAAFLVPRPGLWLNGTVALLATWQGSELPQPPDELARICLHEAGHLLGLTARDAPTFYEGAGHQGPHCFAGVGKKANYGPPEGATRAQIDALVDELKKASCLMFGSLDGGGVGFCPECAKAGRRARGRWPAHVHL